jgi:O-antigen/teichoic acid export membrane protein
MSLRANLVASYVGQGWAALMGVAFLPLYARRLGIEAYGLIGIFFLLQAWMTLIDLGVTPTIIRETSKLQAGTRSAHSTRTLLRSFEWICAAMALAFVIVLLLTSSWISDAWLRPKALSHDLIQRCLETMGVVVSLRWMEQIYRGALQGLQDLVWLGLAQVLVGSLRWAGAYLVVVETHSVQMFFTWQGLLSGVSLIVVIWRTYSRLPAMEDNRVRFSWQALSEIKGFAGGMFLSALLGFFLTQSDKIVISKVLPLESLGAYMLAANAAAGLIQVVTPMSLAIYPRLTELIARGETQLLASTYLRACEWMAVLLVPPAFLLAFFPELTLMAWTGNQGLATTVAPILSFLALGSLCNGLWTLPYYLQLANGGPGLSIRINAIAVAVMVPALIIITPYFGARGAASLWFLLNASYVVVIVTLMHRRLLRQLKWTWYQNAVFIPLGTALVVVILGEVAMPRALSREWAVMSLFCLGVILTIATGLMVPAVRQDALEHVGRWAHARRSGRR